MKLRDFCIRCCVIVIAGSAGFHAPADAAGAGGVPAEAVPDSLPESIRTELLRRMQEIDERQRALEEQLEAVEAQRLEVEALVKRVADLDAYRGGTDASGEAPGPAPEAVGSERQAELEAQEERVPELPRVSAEVGGVLSPRGRLVLEPSVQYLYSSVNRLSIEGFTILPALIVGLIEVFELDRDIYIGALTSRYGLTDRLELELKVPWLYREDRIRTRRLLSESISEEAFSGDGDGLGDVEFDLRYQFPRRQGWPYIVGNLRTKAPTGSDPFDAKYAASNGERLPTGSGFWSINPSFTFIYPTDPAVFFGNIGYLWTIEDRKGDDIGNNTILGDVDPGDAIRLNFGLGLGLNDRSSFSVSYALDLFNRTEIETFDLEAQVFQRNKLLGSDVTVGKLLIGYSLRLPGGQPLNLALGIGATEDAPDTELTFRMPFTILN